MAGANTERLGGQTHKKVWDAVMQPAGYERITSLSSATGLTVPTGARAALIVAVTQAVRWRDDGTSPTGSIGMPLAVDTPFWYTGDLDAIEFVEVTSSAELNISYYREATPAEAGT